MLEVVGVFEYGGQNFVKWRYVDSGAIHEFTLAAFTDAFEPVRPASPPKPVSREKTVISDAERPDLPGGRVGQQTLGVSLGVDCKLVECVADLNGRVCFVDCDDDSDICGVTDFPTWDALIQRQGAERLL